MHMHWNSWWHVGGMWLFWFAVLVLVALAVYLGLHSLKRTDRYRKTPKEILDERFARGEIDREEYDEAVNELRRF